MSKNNENKIERAYERYRKKVVPNIKVPLSFERFRHLVYEGKVDLDHLDGLVDPHVEWDGVMEITDELGISDETLRRWAKRSREIEGLPVLAFDYIHPEGRPLMVPDSGHWWKEQYKAWKRSKRSRAV